MKLRILLACSAVMLTPFALVNSAQAQSTCDGDAAPATDTGNPALPDDFNTGCGYAANAGGGDRNTAIGGFSGASGGNTNADPAQPANGGNTAVGFGSEAGGAASFNVALGSGDGAFGSQSGPNASGGNSSNMALGHGANGSGDGSTNMALGDGANGGGAGSFNIAIGSGATAAGDGSARIAIGSLAESAGNNGVAMGFNTRATGDFSVAIGAGAIADEARTVSFGSVGNTRRLVHVANGNIAAGSTDAVNGGQLFQATLGAANAQAAADAAQATANGAVAAAGQAQNSADAAQGTANTALANAATAQTTANGALTNAAAAQDTADTAIANAAIAQTTAETAIDRGDTLGQSTAAALGGGATYNAATAAISAPTYSIGGSSYRNVGAAFGAVDMRLNQLSNRIDGVIDLAYDIRKEERRGIAAAAAIANAPMPSEPGRVAWAVNTAVFHGEFAYGGALSARLNTKTPLAVTAGFAYAPGGNNIGRVGLAGEF